MNRKFLKNLAIFGCIFNVMSCYCSISAMHNGNDAHYINTVTNEYFNAKSNIEVMKSFLFDNKLPICSRLIALNNVFCNASKDEKLDFISEVIKEYKTRGYSVNTHMLNVFKTLSESHFQCFENLSEDDVQNATKIIKKVYTDNDVFISTHLNVSLSHPTEKTPLNIYISSDQDTVVIYFYDGNNPSDIGFDTTRPWSNPNYSQDKFYLGIRLGYDSPMWSGYDPASGNLSKGLEWHKNQG